MKELGPYDPNLEMFVETKPLRFNEERLRFMRWLAINGRLEHPVAGPTEGDLHTAIVSKHGKDTLKPLNRPLSQYDQSIR